MTTIPVILMILSTSMLNTLPPGEPSGMPTFADAVQLATAGSLDEAEAAFRTVAAADRQSRVAATANLGWIALRRATTDDLTPDRRLAHLRSAEASYLAVARAVDMPDPRVLASLADVRRRIAAEEQQQAPQSKSQAAPQSRQQAESAAKRAQELQDLADRQQDAADSNSSQPERQEQQQELNRQTQEQQEQQPDPSLREAEEAQQRATEALARGDDEAARQAQQQAAQALQEAADRAQEEAKAQAEQPASQADENNDAEQSDAGRSGTGEPVEAKPADPAAELAERILQREQQQRDQGRSRPRGPGTQPVETDW